MPAFRSSDRSLIVDVICYQSDMAFVVHFKTVIARLSLLEIEVSIIHIA